jgi:hypothetical protein
MDDGRVVVLWTPAERSVDFIARLWLRIEHGNNLLLAVGAMGAAMHYLLFNESHDLRLTGQFCLFSGGVGNFQQTLQFQRLAERLAPTLWCPLYMRSQPWSAPAKIEEQ